VDFFILCFYASVFVAPASILAGLVALVQIRRHRKAYGPIAAAERELARVNKEIENAKSARDKMIAENGEMLGRFRERQERERARLERPEEESPSRTVFTRATTTLAEPETLHSTAERRPLAHGQYESLAHKPLRQEFYATPGFHRQRIAIAAASAIGAIATFLPWAYVPILGSVLGSASPEGWISLILFAPSFIVAFAGNSRVPLSGPVRVISTVTAGLASACGIWTIADFEMQARNPAESDSLKTAFMMVSQMGPGVYLCIACGLAVILLAWSLDVASITPRVEK
jgi:hypothetical protein